MSEVLFDYHAVKSGLITSRPLSVCDYDRIVDNGSRLLKVQIKSTTSFDKARGDSYIFRIGGMKNGVESTYKGRVDFMALHIIPTGDWFIVPEGDIPPGTSMRIRNNGKWMAYKNNWEVLK